MLGQTESAWAGIEANPYFWDGVMFVCLGLTALGLLIFVVWLLGLPGRIAISRNHPDAEAVYTMGWVGFLAIVPWIQALIWAFKPTDKVDIRYLPEQERYGELEALQRLSRYAFGKDLPEEQVEALLRRAAGERPAGLGGAGPAAGAGPQDAELRTGKGPDAPSPDPDKPKS